MACGNESDELSAVGLCATCRHVRVVRSDRVSVFYLCELSKVDQRFHEIVFLLGHNHGVSCR
jgi:hypothetical protein